MRGKLEDLQLFRRIVETGSLRQAAEEIGTDPSNVSRRLTALEDQLGAKLIERSRVRSRPTDAGDRYYARLTNILEDLEALNASVGGAADEPIGTLRVAAPLDFGTRYIGPWLHELAAASPRLNVDLHLSDEYVDLMARRIDVTIRIGEVRDANLRARRLGVMPLAIVASRRYVDRAGAPETPAGLDDHEFVLHAGLAVDDGLTLTHDSGGTTTVAVTGRFHVSTLGGAAEIVRAGGGLHFGPLWYFADDIASGALLRVLPEWSPPRFPVHALYLPTRYVPAKIRHFIDLCVDRMRATPGIDAPD
ncbi:MAG: LysR family transcriptional regulator [Gammaproteobacteria bacterium]|nr:LysR family transcriptional regulator [Gammaproteobacteria bacterium]